MRYQWAPASQPTLVRPLRQHLNTCFNGEDPAQRWRWILAAFSYCGRCIGENRRVVYRTRATAEVTRNLSPGKAADRAVPQVSPLA